MKSGALGGFVGNWGAIFATIEPLAVVSESDRPSYKLGGGFKDFLFSPLLGEMVQFD